jgi:tetratricopeptide (TPR) repeat protein
MPYKYTYNQEQEELFFDQIDQVYTLTETAGFQDAEKLLLEIESSFPDPKEDCSVGSILLDSIFSFYEQAGQIEKALPFLLKETAYLQEKLLNEPIKGIGHFVTTGSIYYSLGDLDKARVYFKIAHNKEKGRVFQDFNPDFLHIAVISDTEFEDFKKDFTPNTEEQDELSDEQQELIDDYCEKGNLEMDQGNYSAAIELFRKALKVLPEPAEDWDITGWISASVGDAYFCAKNYQEALVHLLAALKLYGDEEANPFVLLRLGEVYYELGETELAGDYLLRAYRMEGEALFEDDKKYFKFLKKQHQL